MNTNDFYETLKEYALDSENYKRWCKAHTKVFGDLFKSAFLQNEEAKIHLTAALINISKRNFSLAMPKLDMLETVCDNEFDETAVCYFKGLNHELLGSEAIMTEHYEKVRCSSVAPEFVLAFHPYYRTAKLAQKASECSKSVYYYRKALEFYSGTNLDKHVSSVASHIIYDIATLYLYMHEYDECERFLNLSYQYDDSQNQSRDYVNTILLAIRGKQSECARALQTLSPFLRENCQAMTQAIFNGSDPHYCVVPQDRSLYEDFWSSFLQDEKKVKSMILINNICEAEKIISEKLTKALGFMKRTLDCRVEAVAGNIIIRCKNYRVKSLKAEHSVLFSMKPEDLSGWEFLSVEEFEHFGSYPTHG